MFECANDGCTDSDDAAVLCDGAIDRIGSGRGECVAFAMEMDFIDALDIEYKQNDIFPPNDITEDWLKLVDYDPENVVKLSPVKPRRVEVSAII